MTLLQHLDTSEKSPYNVKSFSPSLDYFIFLSLAFFIIVSVCVCVSYFVCASLVVTQRQLLKHSWLHFVLKFQVRFIVYCLCVTRAQHCNVLTQWPTVKG